MPLPTDRVCGMVQAPSTFGTVWGQDAPEGFLAWFPGGRLTRLTLYTAKAMG